jgi:hypothetical protein
MVGVHPLARAARLAAALVIVAVAASAAAKDGTMEEAFQKAVRETGPAYVEAEQELSRGGATAAVTLRAHLGDPDPLARQIAEVLLERIEGRKPEYTEAMDYIDGLPVKLSLTPVPTPSPTGIAAYLKKHYAERVAPYLALRLVKGTDWPRWKVNGVLFYLRDQRAPATSFPLLRFAVETGNDEWRGTAVEALRDIEDREMRGRIGAERTRLRGQGRALPDAITEMEASLPPP